jgi:hypothetical protein
VGVESCKVNMGGRGVCLCVCVCVCGGGHSACVADHESLVGCSDLIGLLALLAWRFDLVYFG